MHVLEKVTAVKADKKQKAPVKDRLLHCTARRIFLGRLISDIFGVLLATACAMHAPFSPFGRLLFFAPLLALSMNHAWRVDRSCLAEMELSIVVRSWFYSLCTGGIALSISGNSFLLSRWGMGLVAGCSLSLVGRFLVRQKMSIWHRSGIFWQKAIHVGSLTEFDTLREQMRLRHIRGVNFAGILLSQAQGGAEQESGDGVPVLGNITDRAQSLRLEGKEVLLISPSALISVPVLLETLAKQCPCWKGRVELVGLAPASMTTDYCADFSSVSLRSRSRFDLNVQFFAKRLIDAVFGFFGSLVTLGMTPVIWLLIQSNDPGPAYFHQRYIAEGRRVGYYLKFRSMVQNADLVLERNPDLKREFARKYKLENDPRILPVGKVLRKYSIDEFPEFFSVLRGDFSFVGPCTISSNEMMRYGKHLDTLLSVRPGLTGFWQMNGRQTTSYEDRVAMDMYYIGYWSIWLDLVLIAKTFLSFFSQKGAY